MEKQAIFSHIDHTLLKAFAAWDEIKALCDEAVKYKTASVCIPPSYVSRVRDTYGREFNICTVIGFPLGYSTTETKVFEAEQAIRDGADEVDMVINIGDVKNGDFDKVFKELCALRAASRGHILKVIVETCYLTRDEKIRLCQLVTEAEADYIKTSTGFGTAGAVLEDIELFREHIGPEVKIKAAGGIQKASDLELFLNAGCDRLGTSSGIRLLNSADSDGHS